MELWHGMNMFSIYKKEIDMLLSGSPVNHPPEAINRLRCLGNDVIILPLKHEQSYHALLEKCTTFREYMALKSNEHGLSSDEIQCLLKLFSGAYEILKNNGICLQILLAEYIIVENDECGRSVFKLCLVPGTYIVDHGNEMNVDGENRMCNSLSNILKLATYGPGADQVVDAVEMADEGSTAARTSEGCQSPSSFVTLLCTLEGILSAGNLSAFFTEARFVASKLRVQVYSIVKRVSVISVYVDNNAGQRVILHDINNETVKCLQNQNAVQHSMLAQFKLYLCKEESLQPLTCHNVRELFTWRSQRVLLFALPSTCTDIPSTIPPEYDPSSVECCGSEYDPPSGDNAYVLVERDLEEQHDCLKNMTRLKRLLHDCIQRAERMHSEAYPLSSNAAQLHLGFAGDLDHSKCILLLRDTLAQLEYLRNDEVLFGCDFAPRRGELMDALRKLRHRCEVDVFGYQDMVLKTWNLFLKFPENIRDDCLSE